MCHNRGVDWACEGVLQVCCLEVPSWERFSGCLCGTYPRAGGIQLSAVRGLAPAGRARSAAEEAQDGVEAREGDGSAGLLLDHGLRAVGHAQPGGAEHVEVVGAVAHRHHA